MFLERPASLSRDPKPANSTDPSNLVGALPRRAAPIAGANPRTQPPSKRIHNCYGPKATHDPWRPVPRDCRTRRQKKPPTTQYLANVRHDATQSTLSRTILDCPPIPIAAIQRLVANQRVRRHSAR